MSTNNILTILNVLYFEDSFVNHLSVKLISPIKIIIMIMIMMMIIIIIIIIPTR